MTAADQKERILKVNEEFCKAKSHSMSGFLIIYGTKWFFIMRSQTLSSGSSGYKLVCFPFQTKAYPDLPLKLIRAEKEENTLI